MSANNQQLKHFGKLELFVQFEPIIAFEFISRKECSYQKTVLEKLLGRWESDERLFAAVEKLSKNGSDVFDQNETLFASFKSP